MTAPNGPAQQRAMRLALSHHVALQPDRITALGLHGTGTALGDPIELGAAAGLCSSMFLALDILNKAVLHKLYRPAQLLEMCMPALAQVSAWCLTCTDADPSYVFYVISGVLLEGHVAPQPLLVAASKSAVGHAESASGMMGLGQAQARLQGWGCTPILHLRSLNQHVLSVLLQQRGKRSMKVPRQTAGNALLSSDQKRSMGVSAFAFQVCPRAAAQPWCIWQS